MQGQQIPQALGNQSIHAISYWEKYVATLFVASLLYLWLLYFTNYTVARKVSDTWYDNVYKMI